MTLRGLIGVVHLPPLPGDPQHDGSGFDAVERAALADAEALATGGVDALVIENFGSVRALLTFPPTQMETPSFSGSFRGRAGQTV